MRDARVWIINLARQDQRKLPKLLNNCFWIFRARHDIDDANRLFPASQRTSDTNVDDTIDRFQIIDTLIRRVPRLVQMQTTLGFLYGSCERGQQPLRGLWSKSEEHTSELQ